MINMDHQRTTTTSAILYAACNKHCLSIGLNGNLADCLLADICQVHKLTIMTKFLLALYVDLSV